MLKEGGTNWGRHVLPSFLWLRYFIDAQKLNVKEAVIYQDNHSDVLLGEYIGTCNAVSSKGYCLCTQV